MALLSVSEECDAIEQIQGLWFHVFIGFSETKDQQHQFDDY